MNADNLYNLIPLILVFVAFSVTVGILLLTTTIRSAVKLIGIPILLVTVFVVVTSIISVLGTPYYGMPKGEFQLIAYTRIQRNNVEYVEIWTKPMKGDTRVYAVPFTHDLQKKLEQAMQQQAQTGKPQVGKFEQNKESGNEQYSFQFYNFPYEKYMPKSK